MKLGTLFISTTLFLGLYSCKHSGDSVFTDETHKDSIRQNIGGLLIRDIHHYNDFNSFIFDIKYSFKDKLDSIYFIGSGSYYSQVPPKDEQLIQVGKWTIFKVSGDREKDVLFISDNSLKAWTKYEISPKTIEQTDLWKKQNINSQVDNWDSVSKIKKIDSNGIVTVTYTYAKKGRIFSFITDDRLIKYKINTDNGLLEITDIVEL